MIPAWLIAKVGQKLAGPIFYGGLILLAVLIAFGLGKCSDRSDDIEEQIKQSNANAEAFGDAAEDAANRIGDRAATESTIDNAVEQVKDKIGNAKSPTAIRNAVLDSLCRKPSHSDDPACAVQPPDPG